MLTIILLSVGLPILAALGYLALRKGHPQLLADTRGIALQTVIVIVVLLAIAGAVAGVLLTRGGEAVEELEGQEISRLEPADATTQAECRIARGTWTSTATTSPSGANGTCS